MAALNGSEEIVKILVEHGSNVDLQNTVFIFFFLFDFDFDFSLIFLIFSFVVVGSFFVGLFHVDCEWLCDIFFFNNFFLLKYGMIALHYAAEKGFEQIVKFLVEHGSNVNLQGEKVFIFFLI